MTLDETSSLSENTKSYVVKVICYNCKAERYYNIEKGISVESALKESTCDFCNCPVINPKVYKSKYNDY